MQPRPDRVLGTIDDSRDLFDRQPLDLEKNQDRPLLRCQPVEPAIDEMNFSGALRGIGNRRRKRLAQEQRREDIANPAAAPEAARVARSDPVDPGRQLRLAPERPEAAEDRDEDLLKGVFALVGRDPERRQKSIHLRRVAIVERTPSPPIPVPATANQLVIGELRNLSRVGVGDAIHPCVFCLGGHDQDFHHLGASADPV
jgi:hypothetical protein